MTLCRCVLVGGAADGREVERARAPAFFAIPDEWFFQYYGPRQFRGPNLAVYPEWKADIAGRHAGIFDFISSECELLS